MRILVTGINGMLGHDLVEKLKPKGYKVIGLDKSASSYDEIEFEKCDVTQAEDIKTKIKLLRPDAIIHAAAFTAVDKAESEKDSAFKVNAEGTKNVALAARLSNIPVIYISTDYVFDGTKEGAYSPSDKTQPLSVYGASKLKGEEGLKANLSNYFIVRTSWLFGKQGPNFVTSIIKLAEQQKELKVVDDQKGKPTFTADLAEGIVRMIDYLKDKKRIKGRTFHFANSGVTTWYEFAKEILKLRAFSDVKIIPVSSAEISKPARRPANSELDTTIFEETFDFNIRPWKEALSDFLAEKVKK